MSSLPQRAVSDRAGHGFTTKVAVAIVVLISLVWALLTLAPASAQEAADPSVFITDAPTVIINEVHASNLDGDESEDGKPEDWIELYNVSNQTMDLTGWGLSNNVKNPFRWTFPPGVTIEPGEYVRVWASKLDRIFNLSELHTNFNVDHGIDPVLLTAPNLTDLGIQVDITTPARTLPDTSWCRVQNGNPSSAFAHCTNPTLEDPNEGPYFAEMVEGVPIIETVSGIYSGAVTTTVTGPEGATLRYTTDGNLPTESSPVVNGPITISSSGPLRVGAFVDGQLPSHAATATYLIDGSGTFDDHRVLFVTMTPSNASSFLGRARSSGAGWIGNAEMIDEGNIHAFNADAAFSDAGRIGSRSGQDTYPLAINFRDSLGESSVKYPIFSQKPGLDSFKKLRLRNSGLDNNNTHLRDAYWQTAATYWDVAGAASEPVSLFVNGEYQGMMDLREREDETLVESTHGVDRDYVEYWTEADSLSGDDAVDNFNDVRDFVRTNDMGNPALYAEAKKMIDVEALGNYFGLYTFSRESDSMWRNDQAYTAPGMDDGWRLRPHDMEVGGGGGAEYGYTASVTSDPRGRYTTGYEFPGVFRELLDSEEFEAMYIQLIADQLNTVFEPSFSTARFADMVNDLEKYMPAHVAWGSDFSSLNLWYSEVDIMTDFLNRRAQFLEPYQMSYFDLDQSRVPVSIDVNDVLGGSIDVNTINTAEWANADGTWDASYYPERPLPLTAVPNPGYEFVRWEGTVNSTDRSIAPNPSNGATYTAVFQATDVISPPVIQALPDRTDETGDLIVIDPVAFDPRGYTLVFDEKKLPKGLDIHPETGRIYGKLTRTGVFETKVRVDNGQERVETVFTWTVVPRNNRETNLPVGVNGNGTGMVATYFDNETLIGEPALTREEVPAVSVGPGTGILPGFGTSDWTIGWEGTLESPVEGVHTLQTVTLSNDGVRLYIDDELVIDQWAGGTTVDNVDVNFALGELKNARVEFIDLSSSAELEFNWRIPGTSLFQAVPSGVMNTTPPPPPVPQLSIDDATVTEGDGVETNGTVDVNLLLEFPATSPVNVTVNTVDGSAVAPGDYTAITDQLVTIPAGELSATVTIAITGDTDVESIEDFTVVVSDVTGAVAGNDVATVTIEDNDIEVPPTPIPPVEPPATNELTSGQTVAGISGAQGSETFYTIEVPAEATNLTVEISGTGDADLYVNADTAPTLADWDCRPYTDLSSNEVCSITNPTPGTWHVMIQGYGAYTADLTATTTSEVTPPTTATVLEDGVVSAPISGAANDEVPFVVEVPSDVASLIVTMAGDGDADLYVNEGSVATLTDWDCRPYVDVSSNEVCVFDNPVAGTWYVMAHGYGAFSATTVTVDFLTAPVG